MEYKNPFKNMFDYKDIKEELEDILDGIVFDDLETLKKYSRDASIFEVMPKIVVWPKNINDIKKLVNFVRNKKEKEPSKYENLSITVRSAGTCMSGGSLNESIILDMVEYLNKFDVHKDYMTAMVEPGVFYRDFEEETKKHNLILPCYTASKNICALGGMIANNCAGEKTLQYGKMENFVEELSVILADGNEYKFKAISRIEALKKSHEPHFEGAVYEKILRLIDKNRDIINKAKPKVSKNSAGYYLWNIERNAMIDLTKIIVGSQGTLGIITKAKIKLVPIKNKNKLLVIFMNKIDKIGELVNKILEYNPESIESYDDSTFRLAIKFLPEMISLMKKNFIKLFISFIPEIIMFLKGGLPKMVIIVEFASNNESEINLKIKNLQENIKDFNFKTKVASSEKEIEKYWSIRRESFNLLRKHIRNKKTAPFIDDICVLPKHLPTFIPEIKKVLDQYKINYTIAGHAGNGNFHIIPLMNLGDQHERSLIPIISEKIYKIVKQYEGTITAEHNDGIIRTPYLNIMYNEKIISLFKETKNIFDPLEIFNPGKKTPSINKKIGSKEYILSHIAKK